MDLTNGFKVRLDNELGKLFQEAIAKTGEDPNKAMGNMIREYHTRAFAEQPQVGKKGKITQQMVISSFDYAKKVYNQEIGITEATHEVERLTGMNRGSALAYITDFRAMMAGKEFSRIMSLGDTEYYLKRIYDEYGEKYFVNAVKAVAKHIAYYHDKAGQAQDSKRKLLKRLLDRYGLSNEIATIPEYVQGNENSKDDTNTGTEQNGIKVGKLANVYLRQLLEKEMISKNLLMELQDQEYSKRNFDLQYPLLVKEGSNYESIRYYKKPLFIRGGRYYMCSQWFATPSNDDRSYLIHWMKRVFDFSVEDLET